MDGNSDNRNNIEARVPPSIYYAVWYLYKRKYLCYLNLVSSVILIIDDLLLSTFGFGTIFSFIMCYWIGMLLIDCIERPAHRNWFCCLLGFSIALTAVFLILMLYVIVLLWAAARVLNDASNYLNRPEFRSDGQFTMDFNFDKDSGSGKIGGTIFESAGSIARAGSNWTFVTMIYWIIVTVVMTFGIILRIYFYFEIWRAMGRIKAANKRANRGTTADATPTGIVVEQSTTPLVADERKEAPEQVDNDDGEQAEENAKPVSANEEIQAE